MWQKWIVFLNTGFCEHQPIEISLRLNSDEYLKLIKLAQAKLSANLSF